MNYQLFSTLGCHLCELAEGLVAQEFSSHPQVWQVVDIAESEELMEQYGVRIPVLRCTRSGRELGWPFDEVSLHHWVAEGELAQG